MNYLKKGLITLALMTGFGIGGCASAPSPAHISSDAKYAADGKIYTNTIAGETSEDASNLSKDLYNQWMAANGIAIRKDLVKDHFDTMAKYKLELTELKKYVSGMVKGETKNSLLADVLTTELCLNQYLSTVIGKSRVTANIELGGVLNTKTSGPSEIDPAILLKIQGMGYFGAVDPKNADAYEKTVADAFKDAETKVQDKIIAIKDKKEKSVIDLKKK